MSKQDARTRALQGTIEGIEKRWGKGAVMRLGDVAATQVDVVPSGSMALDDALGVGGWPRGRVVEIFGRESSGKTTLTLHAIAEVQKQGGTAAFVDAEHALDMNYARNLGVDIDTLLVSQPDSGEQALEITEALVRSGAIDLVVVDSVAALVPRAEIEGEMGDHHVGLQARLMSQALRKLTGVTARTGCVVVFINQIRQKIGVTFGSGEVTTGGNALKFYSSIRVEIRRIGSIKQGDKVLGNKTRIRILKNKLAPPFREVETEIRYGRGICAAGEVLKLAEKAGLLSQSGSWYSLGDERLGNGREAVRLRISEDHTLRDRLVSLIRPDGPPAEAK